MSSYKLVYFDSRGKAEPIRYIFALAKQDFEDKRVEYEDADYINGKEWKQMKPGTLWGTLPELHVNEELRICQTSSIVRYLGEKLGLAGHNDMEKAYIDMIITCVEEFSTVLEQIYYSKNKEFLIKYDSAKIEDWVKRINQFLVANNDGVGWLVGETMTVADVYVCSFVPYVRWYYPDVLKDYPKLQNMFERFKQIPEIASWIEKRPATKF